MSLKRFFFNIYDPFILFFALTKICSLFPNIFFILSLFFLLPFPRAKVMDGTGLVRGYDFTVPPVFRAEHFKRIDVNPLKNLVVIFGSNVNFVAVRNLKVFGILSSRPQNETFASWSLNKSLSTDGLSAPMVP